jgi:hypothetical protein
MKKNIIYTLVAIAALITLDGCKKKEDGIVGTWKVTSATFTPSVTINGTTYTDAYLFLFDAVCEQDNLFIFKDGNQVTFDEGATKCDDDDAQQTFATYSLSGNTLLLIEGDDDDDTTTFTNVTVDEDNLKGTINGDFGGGTNADVQIVWTRQ